LGSSPFQALGYSELRNDAQFAERIGLDSVSNGRLGSVMREVTLDPTPASTTRTPGRRAAIQAGLDSGWP